MLGKFVKSAVTKFLSLKFGADRNVYRLQKLYEDLIKNYNGKVCKNPKALNNILKIIRQLQAISKILKSLLKLINKILKFIKVLKKIAIGLGVIIKILKLFPLPSRYTLVGMIVKMGDLLSKIYFRWKAISLIIVSIDLALKFVAVSLKFLIAKIKFIIDNLKNIVEQLKLCNLSLARELETAMQEVETDIKNIVDEFGSILNDSFDGSDGSGGINGNNNNSYKGFTFKIIEEQTVDKVVAKRRYAVAFNSNGVLALQGNLSFASDGQVLIDELKFKIDTENLVGYSNGGGGTAGGTTDGGTDKVEVDAEGNVIITNDDDNKSNIEEEDNEEIEREVLADFGYDSFEDMQKENSDMQKELNNSIQQNSQDKKLKNTYDKKANKFVSMLRKKALLGNKEARFIINKLNTHQITVEEAKNEWISKRSD